MKNSRIELDVLLQRVDTTAAALSEVSQQLQAVIQQLTAPPSEENEARGKP